jgi:hypothetical protein
MLVGSLSEGPLVVIRLDQDLYDGDGSLALDTVDNLIAWIFTSCKETKCKDFLFVTYRRRCCYRTKIPLTWAEAQSLNCQRIYIVPTTEETDIEDISISISLPKSHNEQVM